MIRELKKVDDHISLFEMKSDSLEVLVTNFGGTIIRLLMPDKNGQKGDVVLGYDSIAEYQAKDAYLGALVGRTANRTRKGTFSLNGKTYTLPLNDGPNSLHGGIHGFSQKVFDAKIQGDSLVLTYLSPDGEEQLAPYRNLYVKRRYADAPLPGHHRSGYPHQHHQSLLFQPLWRPRGYLQPHLTGAQRYIRLY